MGTFLASHGTSAYLATTVTAPLDATLRALDGSCQPDRKAPPSRGAHVPSEFTLKARSSRTRSAACNLQNIFLPPSIATFDRLIDAAHGHVRLMTIAPELPGAIELNSTRHVTRGPCIRGPFQRHRRRNPGRHCRRSGKRHSHLQRHAPPLHHREPGILGTVLTNDDLYAELICDGVHTDPEIVRLWWKAKGPERSILVTDAMAAAGMPEGEYLNSADSPSTSSVAAQQPVAFSPAASSRLIALSPNFIAFYGCRHRPGFALCCPSNPAAMTGLAHRAGSHSLQENPPTSSRSMPPEDWSAPIIGGRQAN